MSPVIMDMPPERPAVIGHNSRESEIERTVAEVRAIYLQANASNPAIGYRLQIIHTAFASDMSDAEFRVLFGYLMHGNRDGVGISVGQPRLGLIAGKCERQVRQATRKLEDAGWLASQKHRQKDATRAGGIPAEAMKAILFEIADRRNSAGQGIVVPIVPKPPVVDRRNTVDRRNSAGLEIPKTAGLEPETGGIQSLRPAEFRRITIRSEPYAPESAHVPTCVSVPAHTREITNPPHWAYNAALDAEERKAQRDVGWTDDGLVAMGEFRAQLLRDFPRVNLAAGLAAATGNQLPAKGTSTAKQVKGAILRQFGFMEQDEAGRDRRAAARLQSPSSGRNFHEAREPWQIRKDEEAENKRRNDEMIRNFDWGSGGAKA